MGMRFQKRVKIFPGITINFSKSGVSTSLGVRGAHVTIGNNKTRTTIGLPGTGLSHTAITEQQKNSNQPVTQNGSSTSFIKLFFKWFFYTFVVLIGLNLALKILDAAITFITHL